MGGGGGGGGGEGVLIVDFFSADPSLDLWDMEPGSVAGKGSVGGCMYGGRGGGGQRGFIDSGLLLLLLSQTNEAWD